MKQIEKIDSYDNYLPIVENFVTLLKNVFGKHYPDGYFTISITPSDQDYLIKDVTKEMYQVRHGVIASNIDVMSKIDAMIKNGFNDLDAEGLFGKIIPGTKYENLLIASIDFKAAQNCMGKIEFIEQLANGVFIRRIMIAQYNIRTDTGTKRLIENTADWEQGRRLIPMTINDFFSLGAGEFVKQRITKFVRT